MLQESRKDPGLRAVQLVKEMIEYRNAEITALSRSLKRGILHLHREPSVKRHPDQVTELRKTLDQIARLIADNDYDISYLQIYISHPTNMVTASSEPVNPEPTRDMAYIQ
jgi:hypothetical protein